MPSLSPCPPSPSPHPRLALPTLVSLDNPLFCLPHASCTPNRALDPVQPARADLGSQPVADPPSACRHRWLFSASKRAAPLPPPLRTGKIAAHTLDVPPFPRFQHRLTPYMIDSLRPSAIDCVLLNLVSTTRLAIVTAISVNSAPLDRAQELRRTHFGKLHATSRVKASGEATQSL